MPPIDNRNIGELISGNVGGVFLGFQEKSDQNQKILCVVIKALDSSKEASEYDLRDIVMMQVKNSIVEKIFIHHSRKKIDLSLLEGVCINGAISTDKDLIVDFTEDKDLETFARKILHDYARTRAEQSKCCVIL